MLLALKGEVHFSNGKHFSFDHKFSKGLTAITGPNESGKSLRLEMIRYALFGVKALRSSNDKYKSIDVTLDFSVVDSTYQVIRTKSNTTLIKDKRTLSTGTTPVNAAILKILGYNLEVFDVANACLQENTTAMTAKTPAERKRMIDKTLGLDALDKLIANAAEELSDNRSIVKVLEGQIASLFEAVPDKPADYEVSSSIQNQMNTMWSKKSQRDAMRAQLGRAFANPPQSFTYDFDIPQQPLEFYIELQATNNARLKEIRELEFTISEKKNSATKVLTREDENSLNKYIDYNIPAQWDVYNKYQELLATYTESPHNEETVDAMYTAFINGSKFKEIALLKSDNVITCPHCHGDFPLGHERVKEIEDSLSPDIIDCYSIWQQHNFPDIKLITTWQKSFKVKEELDKFGTVIEPLTPYKGSIDAVKVILEKNDIYKTQAKDIAFLESKHAELKSAVLLDIDSKVTNRRLFELNEKIIGTSTKLYNDYLQLKEELEPQIQALSYLDQQELDYFAQLERSQEYEAAFANYQTKTKLRLDAETHLATVNLEIARLTAIRNALNELKPKVKSYLVPSLSAVASNFLSQMTNNARNAIDISEDFDITVDGQAVETLSGSGKAVANIAVRLALGTVLTNKIFSVFMADEIDAAMDEARAESTADCLQNLTKVFGQVILISHKKPEADNHIEL